MMLQESVYCRMVLDKSAENSVRLAIRHAKPPRGVVQLLSVTEKQFEKTEYLTGEFSTDVIDSDERVIVL